MIAKFAGRTVAVLGLMAGMATAAGAQTQTVNFEVKPINQFSITSTAVTLTVTTATAGNDPDPVSDASSVWAITTNQTNAKISANIPTDMPAGVTLAVLLGQPAGATSTSKNLASGAAQDLVTGITKLKATGLTVTYTLSATAAAGVIPADSRVVTYTMTPGT
jgi:hypothetical protein